MVMFPSITNFFKTSTYLTPKVDDAPMQFKTAKGTSGTEIYSARFDEEYLTKLLGELGIQVFDQMRRSDGQVKMLLSVVKNPIKSATWDIRAGGDEEIDQEIADFIKYVLFKNIGYPNGGKRKTLRDFISECLTVIEFGFVTFELIHKIVKNDKNYGDYIGLADIGFRHQRSIEEWYLNQDGSIKAVRQMVDGDLGVDAIIPGQHLFVLSMDKEGDNYEGISMLRSCYGSWFRKNIYRKLQAIGIERCAKGVPIGKIPEEMAGQEDYDTQVAEFQAVLDQLGAHEKNGIVLGAGFDLTELKITHDSEKVQNVINDENLEMSKAFLASFLEMGTSGNGGSYALGTDQSDIFLNGIQYIGEMICEKINMDIIEPLVKAKYGEQEYYPELYVTGINDKAGKELAEIVTSLIGAGAVQASAKLQEFMHKTYKLPEIDEDLANKQEETEDKQTENIDAIDKKKLSDHDCCTVEHGKFYQLADKEREAHPVSAMIEDKAEILTELMRKTLRSRADVMLNDVSAIIKSYKNVRNRVIKTKMPDSKAYKTALTQWASGVIDDSFGAVLKELGLNKKDVTLADKAPDVPKTLRDRLTTLILLTSEAQDMDIEKTVYFTFNANFETVSEEALIKEIDRQVEAYFAKNLIETAATNMSSQVVNSTREATFESDDIFADIESFIFLNPNPQSPICKELTGRVFSKEEYETTLYLPPCHHGCKSYIAAQTKGDKNNKPVTGLEINGTKEEQEKILRSKTL